MSVEDKLFELMERLAEGRWEVIFQGENGKRPTGLHVAMRVHGFENWPIHRHLEVDVDTGEQPIQRHQDFKLELHIYGEGALATANSIAMALNNEEVQHYCSEVLDVGFTTEAKIDPLPELRDDMTYENRVLLRIEGHSTLMAMDNVGYFSKVNAEGKVTGAKESEVSFTAP